jgi:uncharacterized short protein YbdD (DUF466 family)
MSDRRGGGRRKGESLGRALRRIIGAPDYETYLEHCRRAGHPPHMTEREFVARWFESRGKGVRCC